MAKLPKQDELLDFSFDVPKTGWMHTPTEFKEGMYCYGTKPKNLEVVGMPNGHDWSPADEDWHLPEGWKDIVLNGMEDLMKKYRSFKLYMDVCVRCGACADKCHFYQGTGDPKNMPVVRAELLRSVYRRYFTTSGKLLGELVGARDLTEDVIKEWHYYFYQCTECRRCSVFCPYGIDQAEITLMGRELLNLLGLNTEWIAGPVANCYMKGNHVGLEPQTIMSNIEFLMEDLQDITGKTINPSFNRKGAEILFEGKDIAEMGLEQYRHNCVSFVFQNYNLIEYMTPKENVQLVDAHATTDTLHQVGLTDDEINRNVLKLSGGQQQRVAIARALASSAPVILADEPTGNLDEDTAHDVTALLVERARSLNKCVIIVSHSNEVAAEGDVILRFSHGKIEVSS